MRIEITVERYEGHFEVYHTTFDDKGKQINRRQQGVAIHEPTEEGFRRALALMDPFNRPVR